MRKTMVTKFKCPETGKSMVKVESVLCGNIEPVEECVYELYEAIAGVFTENIKRCESVGVSNSSNRAKEFPGIE